jgi:hypothetical protein
MYLPTFWCDGKSSFYIVEFRGELGELNKGLLSLACQFDRFQFPLIAISELVRAVTASRFTTRSADPIARVIYLLSISILCSCVRLKKKKKTCVVVCWLATVHSSGCARCEFIDGSWGLLFTELELSKTGNLMPLISICWLLSFHIL